MVIINKITLKRVVCLATLFFFSQSLFSLEIRFADAIHCDEYSFRHQSYCHSTQPLFWSEKEKEIIYNSLNEWPSEVNKITSRLTRKITFYRMTHGYQSKSTFTFKRKNAYAWVEHPNKVYLTDAFFENQKIMAKTNVSFQSYVLLHEFTHLFDRNMKNLSLKEDFLNLYNWVEEADSWVMKNLDQEVFEQQKSELNRLLDLGKKEEVSLLSLEYAGVHGLPTLYAATNPKECFAELITNYFLAPELNNQLPNLVLSWIENLFNK